MTAHMGDHFDYLGDEYDVVDISHGALFHPAAVGLHPSVAETDEERGFEVVFALQEKQLVVQVLRVQLLAWEHEAVCAVCGPDVRGVSPSFTPGAYFFNNVYEGLALPLNFTGELLLAKDFMGHRYVHMGFHPAWKYQHVLELYFHQGALMRATDKSDDMRALREGHGCPLADRPCR